jgi:hypothetical protein
LPGDSSVAWDRVLGAAQQWVPRSVGAALADEIELVR